MSECPSGLLALNKPSGPTSYDCVRQLKRVLQMDRIGHCGTLDPMAEGVLLLLLGPSTRKQAAMMGLEKQYWFRGEFGRFTDTGDRTGQTIADAPFLDITLARLEEVSRGFVGEQDQVPPRVSALKYQGKRHYQWARQGVVVPRPPRRIRIHSFDILLLQEKYWEARVVCSRGTYIRSLVEDVARQLGTAATLDALIRERVGPYRREEALSWEQLLTINKEELLHYCQEPISLGESQAKA